MFFEFINTDCVVRHFVLFKHPQKCAKCIQFSDANQYYYVIIYKYHNHYLSNLQRSYVQPTICTSENWISIERGRSH